MQASGRYRFYAVSVEPPGELAHYAESRDVRFPLYSIGTEAARLYRFAGTPTSVLVSPDGHFIKRWMGAYAAGTLTEIEATLGVRLPGFPTRSAEVSGR